jgi:hypothetical protein
MPAPRLVNGVPPGDALLSRLEVDRAGLAASGAGSALGTAKQHDLPGEGEVDDL